MKINFSVVRVTKACYFYSEFKHNFKYIIHVGTNIILCYNKTIYLEIKIRYLQ